MRIKLIHLVLPALLLPACSQPDPPETEPDPADPMELMSLFPLVDGATWSYNNLDAMGTLIRVEDVQMTANEDGTFLLVDAPDETGEHTESIIERIGTAAMRTHKEVFTSDVKTMIVDYDPGFIRMDDSWQVGDVNNPMYTRRETDGSGANEIIDTREHQFEVLEDGVAVTVPAGTFECVHVKRTRLDLGGSVGEVVDHWYAPGVGKVREVRIDRSEELQSFSIPGGESSP